MKAIGRIVLIACAMAAASAQAQNWPQRPVKVIVPFVAGGNSDSQARIVSERLAAALGHDRLAEEIAKAVREPATIDRLQKIGVEPLGNKPAEFAALLKRDEPVWRDAVKAAGITPE